jgi:flagellar assembly factor FliW
MTVTQTDAGPTTSPYLLFDTGLVGFPDARRFVLIESGGGAFELQSADEASPDFVVVAPAPFFSEDATANLLAPLVVNQRTRHAAQIVLNGQDFPLRAPLIGG